MTFQSAAAAVASAISGAGLFGYGLYLRTKLTSCLRWPQTDGTVSQSGLDIDDGIRISVMYEYTVNGVAHSSSRIQFGTPTTYLRRSSAEAVIRHYPVGSHLTVYYDPENPAQAVLDRSSSGALQYIIGGIILLVLTVLVMLYPSRSNSWDVGLIIARLWD